MNSLTLIYKDEWLAAVEKPSGLLSVPGRTADKQDCVISRLQADGMAPLVVHRLDRDTSGILIVAFDVETQKQLNRQFEQRAVTKSYSAIVAGQVKKPCGTIDAAIRKDLDFQLPPKYKVDRENGKQAITHWKLKTTHHQYSTLSLHPETGRSHQLRVHCESIGHPIVGDPIYGTISGKRLMLHASEIRFIHPKTGSIIQLKSNAEFNVDLTLDSV